MGHAVIEIDEEAEQSLQRLVETTGRSRSDVVREAIKSAEREALLTLASRQALELLQDPDDLAEMRAVARDMGPLPGGALPPREVP